MLQYIVPREMVQREPGGVGLRVCAAGKVEQEVGDVALEVDSIEQSVAQVFLRDVLARPRQEAVVGEGIQEGAWATDCLLFRHLSALSLLVSKQEERGKRRKTEGK
jgi:hypothetical protein